MKRLSVLIALGALAAGCGGGSKSATAKTTTPTGGSMSAAADKTIKVDLTRCKDEGKRVIRMDINHDDRTDVWKLVASSKQKGTNVDVMTCKKVDFNHDGVIDMATSYDDRGVIEMEQFDLDFDNKFDQTTYYERSTKIRVEWDSDYDGKPDVVDKYKGGQIEIRERDTGGKDGNVDGKADYWERFKGGVIDAIGYDDDFNGSVDRWEQAERPDSGKTEIIPDSEKTEATPEGTTPAPAPAPEPAASPAPTGTKPK